MANQYKLVFPSSVPTEGVWDVSSASISLSLNRCAPIRLCGLRLTPALTTVHPPRAPPHWRPYAACQWLRPLPVKQMRCNESDSTRSQYNYTQKEKKISPNFSSKSPAQRRKQEIVGDGGAGCRCLGGEEPIGTTVRFEARGRET